MDKKNKPKWFLVAGLIMIVLAIIAGALYMVVRQISNSKRTQNMPPTVQIISPEAGETIPAGSSLFISVSAIGGAPIRVMELWLDGQLVGQSANQAAGVGAFSDQFTVTLTDGGHMLVVRAVDQNGLIGQSPPIPVYGSSKMADAASLIYPAQEGDTLEGIADELGMDAGTVRAMNPNLGDSGLAAGTGVNLPITDKAVPQQQPAAEQPSAEQPDLTGATYLPAIIPPNPIAAIWGAFTAMNLPKAPSNLIVTPQPKQCLVTLSWMDNADNEDYFRIWFSGLSMPPRVLETVGSSPHKGRVWYQFNTPPGGIYSFWVEAVNGIGAQPSEVVSVGIAPPGLDCQAITAANLLFEVKEITFFGFYDRLYSYLSVEGAPERRFPAHDGEFWFGSLNIERTTIYPFERNILSIPIPEDGVLSLDGKSMGWMGGTLNDLGPFSTSVPASAWDGSEQVIETSNYRIVFTVQPFGAMQAQGSLTFYDPTIREPKNLQDTDTGKRYNPFHATDRILSWEWDGDESAISGFTVYRNGKAFRALEPHERQIIYTPPSTCGANFKFEVAAHTDYGESRRSQPLNVTQEPCPMMAEIQFVSFETGWTTDDDFGGTCDRLEVYYWIYTADTYKTEEKPYNRDNYLFVRCNTLYPFDMLGKKNTLTVPIDPDNPRLLIGVKMMEKDGWMDPDDVMTDITDTITLPNDEWAGFQDERTYIQSSDTAYTTTIIRIRGYQSTGMQ